MEIVMEILTKSIYMIAMLLGGVMFIVIFISLAIDFFKINKLNSLQHKIMEDGFEMDEATKKKLEKIINGKKY